MASAIFIDTHNRDLQVSMVSVTQTDSGLVLRFAAELGKLMDITRKGYVPFEIPVIVATRGYGALNSAGFVEVLGEWNGQHAYVIGIQSMPWMKGTKSLRPCRPIEVRIFGSATIQVVETHTKVSHLHSNVDTATAAYQAVKILSRIYCDNIYLAEGQSDYTVAWRVSPGFFNRGEKAVPEWPQEHRTDIVGSSSSEELTAESIVEMLEEEDDAYLGANFLSFEVNLFED